MVISSVLRSPRPGMSFGTNTKTGFSVRDILDLPDPIGGSGTEETEDENEEASAETLVENESENVQKLGFNAHLCERSTGSYARWTGSAGNLQFSCKEI